MSSGKRFKALDGLRGFAVLLVVVDHGGLIITGDPLGPAGVTIFFVLSGFLITRLILDAQERGVWSMSAFLLARVARLAPALLVMLAVVLVWAVLAGYDAGKIGGEAATAALYVSNFFFVGMEGSPLRHTWSLAVEEQFYLVWPLVLPLIARLRRPIMWLGLLIFASLVARFAVQVFVSYDASYSTLPTNAFALLFGCLLAIDPVEVRPGLAQRAAPVMGAVCIVVAVMAIGSPIIAAPFAVVLVAAALPGAFVFEWRWLRFLGRISYSLYLWHWPLLVLTGQTYAGVGAVLPLGVALALAVASTLLLEEPIRRTWRRQNTANWPVPRRGERGAEVA